MKRLKDRVSERLVTRREKQMLEETYILGEWDYEGVEADCKTTIDPDDHEEYLYYKYVCGDYGEFKREQIYEKMCDALCITIGAGVWTPDRNQVWKVVETLLENGYKDPREHDEAFIDHLSLQVDPADEYAEEAGSLWIRYLLERGTPDEMRT